MGRIKELKNSLLLTAIYTAILLIFWAFDVPCFFKAILGFSCPGCGMSRAVFSVIKLDFAAAFSYHPMFWSLPILYLYFIFGGKVFNKKFLDYGILILIALGFLINWLLTIIWISRKLSFFVDSKPLYML